MFLMGIVTGQGRGSVDQDKNTGIYIGNDENAILDLSDTEAD